MIRLENLAIAVGNFVIKDINLEIHNGEYFVLLGPTGCGKTVLLECLAGIKKIDSGKIWIDNEDVTRWYPEERNIGYLPQDFALFPHMTVEQNIAFGLRARKRSKSEIRTTVDTLCRPLNIGHLLTRYPTGLSGGEKQRVALARALAIKPKVVSLDEPLSALDENTRERLCCELRNIHSIFGTTFIHVSHNLEETSQVADRIAIMNYGTIEQAGTVDDILRHPANRYVAGFTLTRNIFNGISIGTEHGCRISLTDSIQLYSTCEVTGNVLVTIRPEYIQIIRDTYAPINEVDNIFSGKIINFLFKGSYISITVDIGVPITIYTTETSNYNKDKTISQNDKIALRIPPDAVNIMTSNESEHE